MTGKLASPGALLRAISLPSQLSFLSARYFCPCRRGSKMEHEPTLQSPSTKPHFQTQFYKQWV